jgi:F-type H+-transporting ATPase subunit b
MDRLWTIGFQAVNFLLLLLLLRRFLWRPLQATIEQRRKEIEDAEAGVSERSRAAELSRVAYEAKAEGVEQERARMLSEGAAEVAAEREALLSRARAEIDAERLAAHEKLEQERREAADELTEDALDAALVVARRLLYEVRGSLVADGFVAKICEGLEGLPADELASLRAEVASSPTVQVATAPALSDASRPALVARLSRL